MCLRLPKFCTDALADTAPFADSHNSNADTVSDVHQHSDLPALHEPDL